MEIGDKIRHFRTQKGYSQKQMAEILNMSEQGYGNIERGDTDVSWSRIELISKELNVSTGELIGLGETYKFINSNNNAIGNNSNCQVYHSEEALAHKAELLQQEVDALKRERDLQNKLIAALQKEAPQPQS